MPWVIRDVRGAARPASSAVRERQPGRGRWGAVRHLWVAIGCGLLTVALVRPLSRPRGAALPSADEAVVVPDDGTRRAPSGQLRSVDAPAPTASYTLAVYFDEPASALHCEGTIDWTNRATVAVDELWFHLYLNAFRDNSSLFFRASSGASRSGRELARSGGIEVHRLAARRWPGENLWDGAAASSPGDSSDATDIRVPLPRAVEPGERLLLDVSWTSRLPSLVERTGTEGRFHLVAQWFPKLARLEHDGRWAHFAFHPQSEFYSDFGDYSVSIDLPASLAVVATGDKRIDVVSGSRRLLEFDAPRVHDFAWAAAADLELSVHRHHDVAFRYLLPTTPGSLAKTTHEATIGAFDAFEDWLGDYPYATLSVVHPPRSAEPAGGMEYPGLITTGGGWLPRLTGSRQLEGVISHELAHQWFYGLLASDEHLWPFLDEGLTTYAEARWLSSRFGAGSAWELEPLSVSAFAALRFLQADAPRRPIARPAASFTSFFAISQLVYARTAVLLESLARTFGRRCVDESLADYARAHRFSHPGPGDLLAAFGDRCPASAVNLLRIGLFEESHVNYRVASVDTALPCASERPPMGNRSEQASTAAIGSRVRLERQGRLAFPVDVLLRDTDGREFHVSWNGTATEHTIEHCGSAPLALVQIDPNRHVLIDDRLFDNARRSSPSNARVADSLVGLVATALLQWVSL